MLVHSLKTYSAIRDACWEVIERSRNTKPELSNFAHSHLYYYSERCQSLNLLLQEEKLWDCEILMRPALECITRLLFVCIADNEEQLRRIDEFEVAFTQINTISISEKAKKAAFHNADDRITAALIGGAAVPEEELEALKKLWPKQRRKEINQKWSFSEMAREISRFKNEKIDLTAFPSLLHSYGMSSHLIHADRMAMVLVWDRNHRDDDVVDLMTNAHAVGLLCTQNSLLILALKALSATTNVHVDYSTMEPLLAQLLELNNKYQTALYDSQRNLYEDETAPTIGNSVTHKDG